MIVDFCSQICRWDFSVGFATSDNEKKQDAIKKKDEEGKEGKGEEDKETASEKE